MYGKFADDAEREERLRVQSAPTASDVPPGGASTVRPREPLRTMSGPPVPPSQESEKTGPPS